MQDVDDSRIDVERSNEYQGVFSGPSSAQGAERNNNTYR